MSYGSLDSDDKLCSRPPITYICFFSDIFHTPGMLNFTNPTGKPAQENDPLVVHKYISQPLFGGGQVILRPGAEKGKQFVRQDTMVSVISLLCKQTWYHSYSLGAGRWYFRSRTSVSLLAGRIIEANQGEVCRGGGSGTLNKTHLV